MVFQSKSKEETQSFAQNLAKDFLGKGGVIALMGELGAGKTTFTQGFVKGLGITEKIISPTFILMRQHQIPKSNQIFYHLDLYRLEGQINIEELGLKEIFENPKNIILIEWAEKIKGILPKNTLMVVFKKNSEQSRQINILS